MHFVVRTVFGGVLAVLGLAAIGGALTLVISQAMNREVPDRPTGEERQWPVEQVVLTQKDVVPMVEAFGIVKAAKRVEVRAEIGGRIEALGARYVEGGQVDVGDLLVRIDDFNPTAALQDAQIAVAEARARSKQLELDLSQRKGALASLESQLSLAEENLARQRALRDGGVVSSLALQQAEDGLLSAQTAFEAQQLVIDAAQATLESQSLILERANLNVARAQRQLENVTITAPVAGNLSALAAEVGGTVSAGSTLGVIVDPAFYDVVFQLTNAQYARFLADDGRETLKGRTVRVAWNVGQRRLAFDAQISRLNERVSEANGSVEVVARITDPSALGVVRQGSLVAVDLAEPTLSGATLLPASAVSEQGFVFVRGDDGRLTDHRVTVVRRLAQEVVVETDLADGTKVVSRQYPQLAAGVLTEVFDPNAPKPPKEPEKPIDSDAAAEAGDGLALADAGEEAEAGAEAQAQAQAQAVAVAEAKAETETETDTETEAEPEASVDTENAQ